MITKLTIRHYRSIENIELNLGDINVLVGPNGVGKSNIIDSITFIRDAIKNGLDQAVNDRHGIQTIRQWSPTRPYDVSLAIEIAKARWQGKFSLTLRSLRDGFEILNESGELRGVVAGNQLVPLFEPLDESGKRIDWIQPRQKNEEAIFHVSYSRKQSEDTKVKYIQENGGVTIGYPTETSDDLFLNSRYSKSFTMLRRMLRDFESYTIFPNTLRTPQNQSNEPYLESHGNNLTSILKQMRRKRRPEAISEIVNSLKLIVPGLGNITVQSVAGYLTPQFRMGKQNNNKPHTFNVNQMSDGTLRILGLLVALYQEPKPDTIALEEPELTVHPGAFQLITDSIEEVSQANQILVTTHSPEFLDYFRPEQIVAVELQDGITKASKLNESQLNAARERLFTLGELMSIEGIHG